MIKERKHNKFGPNPMHLLQDGADFVPNPPDGGGGDPDPENNPSVTMSRAANNDADNSYNMGIEFGNDGEPIPPESLVEISIFDDNTALLIARAVFSYGQDVANDTPSVDENGDFVQFFQPAFSSDTLDGSVLFLFSVRDYLIESNAISQFLTRTLSFTTKLTLPTNETATSNSVLVDYAYQKVGYSTNKSGTHTCGFRFNGDTDGIADFGAGTLEKIFCDINGINTNVVYPDGAEKDVAIYFELGFKINNVFFFTQNITAMDLFDTSEVLNFRIAGGSMTVLESYNLPTCAYFDVSFQTALQTVPFQTFSGSLTNIRMRNNGQMQAVQGVWATQNVTLMDFQLSSWPTISNAWNTGNLLTVRFNNTGVAVLPSWTVNKLLNVYCNGNNLTALPATWATAEPTLLHLQSNDLATPPAIVYTNILQLRLDSNPMPELSGPDFNIDSIVGFICVNNGLIAWPIASIPTTLNSLRLETNALTPKEVDKVLQQLRDSFDLSNRLIEANLNTNNTPSATGIANRDYLNANGCIIQTDN